MKKARSVLVIVSAIVATVWSLAPHTPGQSEDVQTGKTADVASGDCKQALKLLWQERLGEEVLDLAFTQEESGSLYARILVTKTEVKFLDGKGDVRSEYHRANRVETTTESLHQGKPIIRENGAVDKVGITENQNYVAVTTPLLRGYDYPEKTKFTVFNTAGKVLWEAQTGIFENVHLSPSGDYAIAEPPGVALERPILLIDSSGMEKSIGHPDGRSSCSIAFSEDGEWWALLCGHENAQLMRFSKKGSEIWGTELDDTGVGLKVKVSSEGDTIWASAWRRSGTPTFYRFAFSKEGNLIRRVVSSSCDLPW